MAQAETKTKNWTGEDYGIIVCNIAAVIVVFSIDEIGVIIGVALLIMAGGLAITKRVRRKKMRTEANETTISEPEPTRGMTKESRENLRQKMMLYQQAIRENRNPGETFPETRSRLAKEGLFSQIASKFKDSFKKTTPAEHARPQEETMKHAQRRPLSEKLEWNFDEDDADTINVDVAATNERGHEYASMVKQVLESGDSDWQHRYESLTSLQQDMEVIVRNLAEFHHELKQERELVGHLLKLKRKQPENAQIR